MIHEKDSEHNGKEKSRPNEGDDLRPKERPVVGILEGLKQIVIQFIDRQIVVLDEL